MSEIVRERLQNRMKSLGYSANFVSEKAGLDRSVLGKFLRGDVQELRESNLIKVARVLGCDAAYLRGDTDILNSDLKDTPQIQELVHTLDVPIVGVVEAGSFRPVDWFDDVNLGVIVGGWNPQYKNERQFGFLVRGDSMDQAGIADGDEIVCLDPWEAGVEIGEGDYVVVENKLNGGHTRELTVKELAIEEGNWVLLPRSSNAKHKPIVIPKDYDLSDEREIRIVGIVIAVLRRRPVKFSARGNKAGDKPKTGKLANSLAVAAFLTASSVATACHATVVDTCGPGSVPWDVRPEEKAQGRVEVFGRLHEAKKMIVVVDRMEQSPGDRG